MHVQHAHAHAMPPARAHHARTHHAHTPRRTLPLYVVICALLAQGLDSNATLGNVISAYK